MCNIKKQIKDSKCFKKSILKNKRLFSKACFSLHIKIKEFYSLRKLKNNKQCILVTGGAGYIGTNICKKLVENDYKVVVVDNFSNSYSKHILNLKKTYFDSIIIYNFDLLNNKMLDDVLKKEKVTTVIHLAGKKYIAESFVNEQEYYKQNVELTLLVLKLLEKNNIKKLVFPSSIAVYGNTDIECINENIDCNPISPYAKQKLECEKLIKDWQLKNKSDAIILRLSNPIGANIEFLLGDDALTDKNKGLLPYILSCYNSNQNLVFNGGDHSTRDGTTIRDYIHVEDIAAAFLNATRKCDNKFAIFNIGFSNNGFSVLEILKQVEKSLNKKLCYFFGPKRKGDIPKLISNNQKAKKQLNFTITKTLEDMVNSQIVFERENRK